MTWDVLEPYAREMRRTTTSDGKPQEIYRYVIDDTWFLQATSREGGPAPKEIKLGAFHGGAMNLHDVRTNDVRELIEVRLEANEKHGYTQPGPNDQKPQRTGIYTVSIPVEEGEAAQDTADA